MHAHLGDICYPNGGALIDKKGIKKNGCLTSCHFPNGSTIDWIDWSMVKLMFTIGYRKIWFFDSVFMLSQKTWFYYNTQYRVFLHTKDHHILFLEFLREHQSFLLTGYMKFNKN